MNSLPRWTNPAKKSGRPGLPWKRRSPGRKRKSATKLIDDALDRLECAPHLRKKVFGGTMAEAIKGKRTIKSIEAALNAEVSGVNNTINTNRGIILEFMEAYDGNLVLDKDELETRSTIYVESELRRRLDAANAAKERARLAEEARKAREEAEQAKTKLKEQGKPPVPPVPAPINMTAFEPDPEPIQASSPLIPRPRLVKKKNGDNSRMLFLMYLPSSGRPVRSSFILPTSAVWPILPTLSTKHGKNAKRQEVRNENLALHGTTLGSMVPCPVPAV